jgi:hypothetical protein
MKYVFSTHTRPARPLWKAVVYESLRLVAVVLAVGAIAGMALR